MDLRLPDTIRLTIVAQTTTEPALLVSFDNINEIDLIWKCSVVTERTHMSGPKAYSLACAVIKKCKGKVIGGQGAVVNPLKSCDKSKLYSFQRMETRVQVVKMFQMQLKH